MARKVFHLNGIIFRRGGLYNKAWKLEINKGIFEKTSQKFFISLLSFPLKCKVGWRSSLGTEHKYK